jgi:hypothetical protein
MYLTCFTYPDRAESRHYVVHLASPLAASSHGIGFFLEPLDDNVGRAGVKIKLGAPTETVFFVADALTSTFWPFGGGGRRASKDALMM